MERVEATNIHRIEWCCQQLGVTPGQLAAEVGISTGTMDKLMNGEGALTFAQLKKSLTTLGVAFCSS